MRAIHSIRVGITTVVFVTSILKCSDVGSLVNPGYKYNEQQAYPTRDVTKHIDEKKFIICKGCARFPIARIVVSASAKERAWLRIPVSQEDFTYKILKRPKLLAKQSLKVFLKLKFEINVITYPTAINLWLWVPFSTGLVRVVSWFSVTATTGTEWLAEPNMAVGRAIRTTPTRLTTVIFLSRCIPCNIRIKFTYVLQGPLDAKIFHLEGGLQPLPYT